MMKRVFTGLTLAVGLAFGALGDVTVQKARFGSIKASGSVVTNVVADAEITNVANKVARAMKMEKLGAYLWAMEAAHADWDVATNRLSKAYPSYKPFGCTGVHAGHFHGRNLDWTFDFGATVVMRSPASDGKYACIGIVEGAPGVTDDAVASGKWLAAYDSIPFTWADGINEYGVVAQQNVLQKRTDKSAAWRTNSVGKVICFAIIRYALDRCSSAYEAAHLINNKVFIPSEYAYDFHYLVSDATSAYVVEDGKVIAHSAETPTDVMTNFRIDGILVGDDKTLDWNSVEPYGIGLERYDRIRQNGNNNATLAGMVATMKDVWYTKSYKVETSPYWYTEFCETGTERSVANAKAAPEVFYTVVTNERAIFEAEHESGASYRGGHTWQTTHMSVYDQQELTLRLWTQEDDGSEKVFYLFPDKDRDYATNASVDGKIATITAQMADKQDFLYKNGAEVYSPWSCKTASVALTPIRDAPANTFTISGIKNVRYDTAYDMWEADVQGSIGGTAYTAADMIFDTWSDVLAMSNDAYRVYFGSYQYKIPKYSILLERMKVGYEKIKTDRRVETELTASMSNLVVVGAVKTAIDAKYAKPSTGIPYADLASGVKTSLDSADSAYQKPTSGIPSSDLASSIVSDIAQAVGQTNSIRAIYAASNRSAVDAEYNLYTNGVKYVASDMDVVLYQKWDERHEAYWEGIFDNGSVRATFRMWYDGKWYAWRSTIPRVVEMEGTRDAKTLDFGIPLGTVTRVDLGLVKHATIVPSYRRINGMPLTNDVTIGLSGRVYDFDNGNNLQRHMYEALTNIIQTFGGTVTNPPSSF